MTTTTMTTTMTRTFVRINTRGRILAWFLAIVAASLLLTLFIVAESLQAQTSRDVAAELEHEMRKFRVYAAQAIDPSTGEAYTDPDELLLKYLVEATPEVDEALFSVVDGQPGYRTRNETPVRLDLDPTVIADATAATAPVTRMISTPEGDVAYAVMPVATSASDTRGALVVVESLAAKENALARTIRVVAIVSGLSLAVAGVVSWLVAGRVLSPIRKVRDAAEAIGAGDLSARIATKDRGAKDDVARLASTFNRMLDRVENAFLTQRQFLDDAAHELRTPLTIVRGHLELPDAERSAEQRNLILEEVDRMDRIVGDLLVLAKADRPDFLSRERVDLTDLVLGVAAKARLLDDRAWGVPSVAGCNATVDGQRITQALMQLVANAVAFTKVGQAVHISSWLTDDGIEFVVEDAGPGIPASERERVFQRFERGGGTKTTGLGLSIVDSIVSAHGGVVEIRDSALGGAAVAIVLPASAIDLEVHTNWDEEEEA